MAKQAKKIAVGNGYELQFNQRARGQETHFWVGTIYKDGKQVGSFNNNGHGGSTIIHSHEVERDFEKMVDEAGKKLGKDLSKQFERADTIIHVAELLGYEKDFKTASFEETLQLWIVSCEG